MVNLNKLNKPVSKISQKSLISMVQELIKVRQPIIQMLIAFLLQVKKRI